MFSFTSVCTDNTITIELMRVDDNGRCSDIEANSRISVALASLSERTFELYFYSLNGIHSVAVLH